MGFSEWGKWHWILLAFCCAITILVLVILGVPAGLGHSITNLYFVPAGIFTIGTCGSDTMPMNYSIQIQPDFEQSFLNKFGEPEPDRNLTLPHLHSYAERQAIIDSLMNQAGITSSADSVIGLYEFPDARVLLIDQNTSVAEVMQTQEKIRTFIITSVIVSNMHSDDSAIKINESFASRINTLSHPERDTGNYTYEYSVAITRIDLVLPPPENTTAPLYIVRKNNIDRYSYPDGRSFAEIITTGTFYVLYGQRVERVTGTSAVTLDPSWKECTPQMEISGEGTTTGEVKYTVKLARSSERILRSRLIVTSAYIQHYDVNMGSASQWESSDSTGCSC